MWEFLAPIVGSLLGGSSSGDQTTTTQQQLPDFLQQYAPSYAQAGWNLFNQPYQAYPNETVAPFAQDQESAMDMVRQQATGQQNPLYGASQQQTMDTINGNYLNPQTNPYLQQTYDLAADRMTDAFSRGTAAQTDAAFAQQGAFGGSAWDEKQQANATSLGDSLAGLGANIFGGNYANERNRQRGSSRRSSTRTPSFRRSARCSIRISASRRSRPRRVFRRLTGCWAARWADSGCTTPAGRPGRGAVTAC